MLTVALGIMILVAWLALEVVLRPPGAASSLERAPTDRFSTPLLLLGYAAAIGLPLALASLGRADVGSVGELAWIGVAIGLAGIGLRAWAMRTLGTSYTRTLRTVAGQSLVTSGPYHWIRHPGYAASLAVWVGAGLAFRSWIGAIAALALVGAAYVWRIRSEERMLADVFGDAWRAYARRTARLVPGLF